MPSDEDGDPYDEAHPGREQERKRPPQPAHVRERDEEPTRQEEDGERAAHRDERERDTEIGDEHVLEHVHRLEVLLADRVDRADEREDGDHHAGAEEDGAAPRRQIGAAPSPEPVEALEEEHERHDGAGEHERRRRPGRPRARSKEVHTLRLDQSSGGSRGSPDPVTGR